MRQEIPDLALVREILASPLAKPVIEEHEGRKLAQRRGLIDRLRALADDPEAGQRAQAKVAAAQQRLDKARADLKAAELAQMEASGAASALSSAGQLGRARLQRELREGADPRIAGFITEVDYLWSERTRDLIVVRPTNVTNFLGIRGGGARYVDNVEEVAALRALLREASADARAMQLEALARDEITRRLSAWCDRMHKPLRDLGLVPPEFTDAGITYPGQPTAA